MTNKPSPFASSAILACHIAFLTFKISGTKLNFVPASPCAGFILATELRWSVIQYRCFLTGMAHGMVLTQVYSVTRVIVCFKNSDQNAVSTLWRAIEGFRRPHSKSMCLSFWFNSDNLALLSLHHYYTWEIRPDSSIVMVQG